MSKLLLASNNPGKLIEIQALLQDLEVELVTPALLGLELTVEENGQTYAENAALKGLAFARLSGMLTLADDSGLEVDALDGLPGLHSARFSPKPGASDADRRRYLLERLEGTPPPWPARFRCLIALVTPAGVVRSTEGVCSGEIISQERGQNGFGYDPIFLIPQLGRTMAELSMDEKNQLSHRARAVLAARPYLADYLRNESLTDEG
ncbi:MAG: RdgB/HAM1 family non-canonical purine NTP pyrophosphatase [Anaerolineales bacterium]|nr:RdgB/HAM1 family non-canonical purine NTP pyrophosphatase [Anaerolineales bacterium]